MKKLLTALLTGQAGRVKSALTALIVGGLTLAITKSGFTLDAGHAEQVAIFATIAAGWLLEAIAAKIGVDGVKKIQDAIKTANPAVRSDGDAGTVTMGTIQGLLDEGGHYALPATVQIDKANRRDSEPPP